MYKIKQLIDKGLDLGSLPADIQDDINSIKEASNNFTEENDLAMEMDKVIVEKIEKTKQPAENPFIGDAFLHLLPAFSHPLGQFG